MFLFFLLMLSLSSEDKVVHNEQAAGSSNEGKNSENGGIKKEENENEEENHVNKEESVKQDNNNENDASDDKSSGETEKSQNEAKEQEKDEEDEEDEEQGDDKTNKEENDDDDDSNGEENTENEKKAEEPEKEIPFTTIMRQIVDEGQYPEPNSKRAWVSVYSFDIYPNFGYLQMLVVLGYSLKSFSPNYDRVLIIWDNLGKEDMVMSILKKVWTHIILRPHIQWPEGTNISKKENAYWFKYYAWTLTQYEKIAFVAADTLIFRDISFVFDYPSPSFPYDMNRYQMADGGPSLMHDFFVIVPNLDDFISLLELTVPFLDAPESKWGSLGTYDTAILRQYFTRETCILPITVIGENGGYTGSILQNPYNPSTRVINGATHFADDTKPWFYRRVLYSEVWLILASSVYKRLDVPFSTEQFGDKAEEFVQALFSGVDDFNRLRTLSDLMRAEEEDFTMHNVYPESHHSGTKRNITMLVLLIFASLLMLKSTIGTTNPFNIFITKIENKVDQFMRLEEVQENKPKARAEKEHEKKKKHRKHKRKTTDANNHEQIELPEAVENYQIHEEDEPNKIVEEEVPFQA